MSFNLKYTLVGTGWVNCTVSDDIASCEVTASYLTDALSLLIIAATAVASGFRAATFSFDEEPGEFRWILEAPQLNLRSLEIREFPNLWGEKPNSEGRLLFRTEVRPMVFAKAVRAAAAAVLAEHGSEGYTALWVEHPFPDRELALLETAIARGYDAV
jgi:hypothetical protein